MNNFSVKDYWDSRYAGGGTSGGGSYGKLRDFKLEVLNRLITGTGTRTLVDLGCGDGSVAEGIQVEQYTGLDIAPEAVKMCRDRPGSDSRKFFTLDEFNQDSYKQGFDMAISLDVIYHLVEEELFRAHISSLFSMASKAVLIYSSDMIAENPTSGHVSHRKFTEYVAAEYKDWRLAEIIKNRYPVSNKTTKGSFADFYLYLPVNSGE